MAIQRSEHATHPQVREHGPPLPSSAEARQAIRAEYEQLDPALKGALLRRGGIYTQLTSRRMRQRDAETLEERSGTSGLPAGAPGDSEIAKLEAERALLAVELELAQLMVEVQSKLAALLDRLGSDATAHPTGRD